VDVGFAFGLAQSPGHGTVGITIMPPDETGIISPNRAIQAAQQQIEPNRAKLLAAHADERHLFVWVDGFDPITMWAMEPEREHGHHGSPSLVLPSTRCGSPRAHGSQGSSSGGFTPPSPWTVDLLSDALWQQHRPRMTNSEELRRTFLQFSLQRELQRATVEQERASLAVLAVNVAANWSDAFPLWKSRA
jgi:hypothetical protein